MQLVGCDQTALKLHIESLFKQGMSWGNYGNQPGCWSVDHTKPFAMFDLTDPKQLDECCNFKNLAPMWHIENLKKSDKFDSKDTEYEDLIKLLPHNKEKALLSVH
jgi:hypothetical protein